MGFLTLEKARSLAAERGMDLVEVAPDAKPPVCKLMDIGKQKYKNKKKMHDAKKRQHVVELKEIWFRPNTDNHDMNIKLGYASKFLQQGCRVALTMRFRGRERQRKELGIKRLQEIGESLTEFGKVEQLSDSVGNRVQLMIAPVKGKKSSIIKPLGMNNSDNADEIIADEEMSDMIISDDTMSDEIISNDDTSNEPAEVIKEIGHAETENT